MDYKVMQERIKQIHEKVSRMEGQMNKLFSEDCGIDRRLMKLEAINIPQMKEQLMILKLKNVESNAEARTKTWFWAKIAAFVSFVTSIVASAWIYLAQ